MFFAGEVDFVILIASKTLPDPDKRLSSLESLFTDPLSTSPSNVDIEWRAGLFFLLMTTNKGLSLNSYKSRKMMEAQELNWDLQSLIYRLKMGTNPSTGALFLGSSRSKFYWINREILFIAEDEVLCRKEIGSGCVTVIIPASLTNQIM